MCIRGSQICLILTVCCAYFIRGAAATPPNLSCKMINGLVNEAQGNFEAVGETGKASAELQATAASCSIANGELGLQQFYCNWSFPYRADSARLWFNRLNWRAKSCLEEIRQLDTDQLVNHPDSFDLKTYQSKNVDVSISLKDKAALQKSLVFIRFQMSPSSKR